MAEAENAQDRLPEKQPKRLVPGLFSSISDAELALQQIMDDPPES